MTDHKKLQDKNMGTTDTEAWEVFKFAEKQRKKKEAGKKYQSILEQFCKEGERHK